MKKGQIPYMDPEILEDVRQPLLAAVDLGSTTIVAYLMDGLTGRRLSVRRFSAFGISSLYWGSHCLPATSISSTIWRISSGVHTAPVRGSIMAA